MTSYLDEQGAQKLWGKVNERVDINEILPKNAIAHNSIARGKNITYKFKDGSLYTSIESGTFDDVFVGDYFYIYFNYPVLYCSSNGQSSVSYNYSYASPYKLYIGELDRYYQVGETSNNECYYRHHAVIIPENSICGGAMHITASTSGGYVSTKLYTLLLPIVQAQLESVFNGRLVSRKTPLSSGFSNNKVTGSQYTSYVELINQSLLLGYRPVTLGNASGLYYEFGGDVDQLRLFSICPSLTRQHTALRDVYDSTSFCGFTSYGNVGSQTMLATSNFRTTFLIG